MVLTNVLIPLRGPPRNAAAPTNGDRSSPLPHRVQCGQAPGGKESHSWTLDKGTVSLSTNHPVPCQTLTPRRMAHFCAGKVVSWAFVPQTAMPAPAT